MTEIRQRVRLKDIKKGELVRLSPSDNAPVWIRGEYQRDTKRFEMQRWDDISQFAYWSPTRLVFNDFTF
jgi:hypothetical protein